MRFSPEVLIYLQTVKNFLSNNEDAKSYFLSFVDEEDFYEKLLEISEINFTKNGNPELSREQFEFLRASMMLFKNIDDENFIYDYSPKNIKFKLK